METRPYYPADVPHYASLTVHGQDVAQLCQFIWISEDIGFEGPRVQLPVCEYV
jgi:hypothetical protein